MDLRQLEIIRAIAETGSFTAAGHKLHVSQSAISRQILLLEDELKEPVFLRVGRRIRITPAGEALLQLSHRVFQDLKDTTAGITDSQESLRGTVRLLGGMTEVPGSDWLAAQDNATALSQAPAVEGATNWHRKAGIVTHVFTHFPLELVVYVARVPPRTRAPEGMRWVPLATLHDEALPNVMRKVIAHGLGA